MPRISPVLPRAVLLAALACCCGCSNNEAGGGTGAEKLPPLQFPPDPEAIDNLYEHSVLVAETAVATFPGAVQPVFDLAQVHRRFGYNNEAIATYRRGLEIEPARPDAHLAIGFLASQRAEGEGGTSADFEAALDAYREALQLDPDIAGAHTRIGMIYAHQGELEKAIASYQREIATGNAGYELYFNLGQALQLQGEHAAAVETLNKALDHEPDDLNALYAKFQAERAAGDGEQAQKTLEKWQSLREADGDSGDGTSEPLDRARELLYTCDAYYRAGLVYADAGMEREALDHFRAALVFAPGNRGVALVLIEYLRSHGGAARALEEGRGILEAQPDNSELLYKLAGLASELHERDVAEELLGRVLKIDTDHTDATRELARSMLFSPELDNSTFNAAMRLAHRAVELERSAASLDVLAYGLFRAGKRAEAVRALEEAVALDPANAALRQRLESVRAQ